MEARAGGSFCLNSEHTQRHRTEDAVGHPVSTVISNDVRFRDVISMYSKTALRFLPCISKQMWREKINKGL